MLCSDQIAGQRREPGTLGDGRVAPYDPQGEHERQPRELMPEFPEVIAAEISAGPGSLERLVADQEKPRVDLKRLGKRERGPLETVAEAVFSGQQHLQEVHRGVGLRGEPYGAAVEFLDRYAGEEKNALHRTDGADGEVGEQAVLLVRRGVLDGGRGADVQSSLPQHGVKASGDPVYEAVAGAVEIGSQGGEDGGAVRVLDVSNVDRHW